MSGRTVRPASLGILMLLAGCGAGPARPSAAASNQARPPAIGSGAAEARPAVEEATRGWLGVRLGRSAGGEHGVLVQSVVPGSPAALAGLLPGDWILRIDNEPALEPEQVVDLVSSRPPGARLAFALKRHGEDRLLAVQLGERPANPVELKRREFVGQPAPAWDLKAVVGSVPASPKGWRGRVVVLEFWAEWCQVCPLLVPVMNAWKKRWEGQGVEVVGVTTDSFDTATRAVQSRDLRHTIAVDPAGATTGAYAANALPTVFVIDQKGVIREMVVGYDARALREIEVLVESLLDAGVSSR